MSSELATLACRRFLSWWQLFIRRARGLLNVCQHQVNLLLISIGSAERELKVDSNFLCIQWVLKLFLPYSCHVRLHCGKERFDPLTVFHMNLTFPVPTKNNHRSCHDLEVAWPGHLAQGPLPDSTTGHSWGPSLSGPFPSQMAKADSLGADVHSLIHAGNFRIPSWMLQKKKLHTKANINPNTALLGLRNLG